ncbi:MAG: RNA polymerase sigma factor [Planctomycetota bacterium]
MSLTRAVVRGDRAALDRLHALHAAPLYRFVFHRTGGAAAETEEIVQETFLAALQGLHRFRGRSSLFTWLCGIARHQISRGRRRRARERVARVLEESDEEIAGIVARLESEELPEKALEREETQELVGATMSSLPPFYQQILTDKYVRSLSVKEIARRSGRSAKSVESGLTRARDAFRRAFELIARRLQGEVGHA